MTRTQLRDLLRRRLQEETADQWTDSELNLLLLSGLRKLQLAILSIDPEAFIEMHKADIVDATSNPRQLRVYSWPEGTLYEISLSTKAAGTLTYTRLERKSYQDIARGKRSGTSSLAYARFGTGFFVLDPPPSSAVSEGLLAEVVVALSMSADTDVPEVPLPLHEAITYFAQLEALAETGEPTAEVKKDLQAVLALIPNYYQRGAAESSQVRVEGVGKGY